jgi:hypothetical protein
VRRAQESGTFADLFEDDLHAVAMRLNDAMPLVALPSSPQTRYARPKYSREQTAQLSDEARRRKRSISASCDGR